MDTIEFTVIETDDEEAGPTVAIWINGRSLLETLRDVEMPFAIKEGHPNIAGNYVGLSSGAVPDLWLHFHGDASVVYSGWDKVALFVCECGDPGCWPLEAHIGVSEDTVTWSDFEQPHRGQHSRASHWRYDGFGPFVFDRDQYEEALKSLEYRTSTSQETTEWHIT